MDLSTTLRRRTPAVSLPRFALRRRTPAAILLVAFAALSLLSSCATASSRGRTPIAAPPAGPPAEKAFPEIMVPVPELIMGVAAADRDRLAAFILKNNPALEGARARNMAALYMEEAALEGVNADVAFAQMCVETGFLRFGGLVTPEMNNFCGLGSIGPGQPGNSFPDERTGVRAHVQHLKAYGSAEPLNLAAVDPRYRYVTPKGKSPTIAGLARTWAADPEYGNKILNMLSRLYSS